jgi:hypothetical protein
MVDVDFEVAGDMAHCQAVYAASIPGSERPPSLGVDFYHLIKKNGRWWITSVVNEVLRPGVDIPEKLKKKTLKYIKELKSKSKKSGK